jgi:hypothetical protein
MLVWKPSEENNTTARGRIVDEVLWIKRYIMNDIGLNDVSAGKSLVVYNDNNNNNYYYSNYYYYVTLIFVMEPI